jgi:hypothetical protein
LLQWWHPRLGGKLTTSNNLMKIVKKLIIVKLVQLSNFYSRYWPVHVSGIPSQKGFFPFCKGVKPRCLAGEERRLPFEGKNSRLKNNYWSWHLISILCIKKIDFDRTFVKLKLIVLVTSALWRKKVLMWKEKKYIYGKKSLFDMQS